MKEKYVKPMAAFQPLDIASDLSSGCQYQANFQFGICTIEIPEWGETLYSEEVCDISFEDFPCYHVPAASSNIFES